jgi:preprotein translocase subunit SecG
MLFGIAVVIYVFVCICLVLLVIIQSDKGGGISGAIGGGLSGANALLGTQDAANILTRLTTGFAIAFMALCIALSLVLSRTTMEATKSELQKRAEQQQKFSPSSALGGALPLKEGGEGEATIPIEEQEAQQAQGTPPMQEEQDAQPAQGAQQTQSTQQAPLPIKEE